MTSSAHKQIVPMSALAASEAYISNKLITKDEMTSLIKNLYSEVVENQSCEIGQVGIAHVAGRKP